MLTTLDASRLEVRATDGSVLRLSRRPDGLVELSTAQARQDGAAEVSMRLDGDTAAEVGVWLDGGSEMGEN